MGRLQEASGQHLFVVDREGMWAPLRTRSTRVPVEGKHLCYFQTLTLPRLLVVLLVQPLMLVLLLALLLLPMLLQGLVTDAKQVDFFTNATAYEDWPSGGLLGNGTGQ